VAQDAMILVHVAAELNARNFLHEIPIATVENKSTTHRTHRSHDDIGRF
jgi:hypothetical protein